MNDNNGQLPDKDVRGGIIVVFGALLLLFFFSYVPQIFHGMQPPVSIEEAIPPYGEEATPISQVVTTPKDCSFPSQVSAMSALKEQEGRQ